MKRINKQETIIRVWEYQILYLQKSDYFSVENRGKVLLIPKDIIYKHKDKNISIFYYVKYKFALKTN